MKERTVFWWVDVFLLRLIEFQRSVTLFRLQSQLWVGVACAIMAGAIVAGKATDQWGAITWRRHDTDPSYAAYPAAFIMAIVFVMVALLRTRLVVPTAWQAIKESRHVPAAYQVLPQV